MLAHCGRLHESCKSVRSISEPLFHGGGSPHGNLDRNLALMPPLWHAVDEQHIEVWQFSTTYDIWLSPGFMCLISQRSFGCSRATQPKLCACTSRSQKQVNKCAIMCF